MTAMNIVKSHDRIVVITDGAGYNDQGVLLSIDNKVEMLPQFPGFLMQSGGSAWTPAIVAMAGFFARDTDQLFEKIESLLPQVVSKFSGISDVPMGRVLFGGWSNSRGSMRLGCVFSEEAAALEQENQGSGEVVQPDAFQLLEFDGDQLLMQPPFPVRLWLDGYGGRISDVSKIADIDVFASFALAAQRTIGAPYRGVGGFGQITTVTQSQVSARVFERYEHDIVGEVMMPLAFTWKAKRPAGGSVTAPVANTAGLSRQQRRAHEAQQRKRAVREVL